jgi:hypothetical protein
MHEVCPKQDAVMPLPMCAPATGAVAFVAVEPTVVSYRPRTRPADIFMRRLLRVPTGDGSAKAAENIFGASVLLSAVRCMLTYVLLPLLAPVVDLTGGVGPVVGLLIGTVSAVAIVASMRRFWRADHRLRWAYTVIGGGIIVLLVVSAVSDIALLV